MASNDLIENHPALMMSGPKRKFGFLETFNFFETKPRGKMRSRLYLQTQKLKAKKKLNIAKRTFV